MNIYNTLTNKKESFEPIESGKVSFYACGVTVYDRCHIGHGRSAVTFDILRNYLEHIGYEVTFAKNFTDIDDKIIERANREGIDWKDIVEKNLQYHNNDMEQLGIRKPTKEPRATQYIDSIINMIDGLIKTDNAYESAGDVYFTVHNDSDYGKLSNKNIDELQAGSRVEVNNNKKDPLDFTLWKASKPNEPSWESPWGMGRPGWHIECSAMNYSLFGDQLDIHGGGSDLQFPHHENEIAQSEAFTGKQYAKYWVHNGMINVKGSKMGKSDGNATYLYKVLEQFHHETIRLFCITAHYRQTLDYSTEKLIELETSLNKMYGSIQNWENAFAYDRTGKDFVDEIVDAYTVYAEGFYESLNDDLNTPELLACLHQFIHKINLIVMNKLDKNSVSKLHLLADKAIFMFSSITGVLALKPGEWFDSQLTIEKDELVGMISEREMARANKQFEKSDEIRNYLKDKGIELSDSVNGTQYTTHRIR